MKADRANKVVFSLYQIKRRAFWWRTPGIFRTDGFDMSLFSKPLTAVQGITMSCNSTYLNSVLVMPNQSALEHNGRTLPCSAMRELVCNSGELRPGQKPSSFGCVKTANISVSSCSE